MSENTTKTGNIRAIHARSASSAIEPDSCFDFVDGAHVPNAETRKRQAILDEEYKLRQSAIAALTDAHKQAGRSHDKETIDKLWTALLKRAEDMGIEPALLCFMELTEAQNAKDVPRSTFN